MDNPLSRRFAPSGLIIAGIGFFLTRFTVTLAAYESPMRFFIAGVVPLILGLGLATFGIALVVGDFERSFVDTVTLWCVGGAASMLVLVLLTLVGNGTSLAMEPIRSQTYLSNFLIGGSVGGALTGVYAGRSADQRAELAQQASQLEMVNRLLRDEVLNAITVVRGRAEVLRVTDDDDSVAAIERRSEDIESTIQNVKHITQDGTTNLDATLIERCIDEAVADVRDRYPDAEITVDGIDADGVTVWANPLLEDAVLHLVENAVAYRDAPTPAAEIDVTATDSTVTLSVADNGPGLPERQRALIERGEIGDYDDRSTGFGLNIVRLLARSYDGATDATVTDSGTTITLTLRRADTPAIEADVQTLSRMDLGVAVGASLVAAVVMGIFLQSVAGSVPVIGALYGSADRWVGWITHTFHSFVFGLVYAGLVTLVPERYGDRLRYYGVGFAWAGALWLVAASLVMPLWLRLVGIQAPLPTLQLISLIGHLLWGGTMAMLYRAGRSQFQ